MTTVEWSPPYGAAVYLGIGVGLLVLLALAWRLAKSPTARYWPFLIVRLAIFGLLAALLLNPVRVREDRLPPRLPSVAYLVDCSRSMALDTPTSRLEQVKAALVESNRLLPTANQPRIALYRFGQELVAASDVEQLLPEDDATQLLEALQRLPSLAQEDLPKNIVVFSDGRATQSADFEETAAAYRRLDIPIHVFPVGDPKASRDVAVQDVIAPRDALAGARVPVRVVLRSHGYDNQRAEVRIRTLADPHRKPLASLGITLKEGQQQQELLIAHDPAAGKLVVEVPPLEGEATQENNAVPFQIGAARRKIRVIYMEGTIVPFDEYHWLRDALIEEPNIECLPIVVNNQYIAQPTLHRVTDPSRGYPTTREELFTYDVIICSDINRTAFSQAQLDWTVELVAKRGGGFAMIGGVTSFGAGFWDQTVWNEMIPVDMSGEATAQGRGFLGMPFRIQVPPEAERHPIWRIVDDPVKNRRILKQMPPFSGTNFVERLKPAATALGYSDRPLSNGGAMPIFSCEPFGRGRSFAMSTDTTVEWGRYFESQWGEPGDNRYFRKFWRNVIYWLSENSAGLNRRLRIEVDKVVYHPGQPIKISAHAFDDQLEETTRYRLVARLRPATTDNHSSAPPQAIQEVALAAGGSDSRYTGELTSPSLRSLPAPATEAGTPMRSAVLEVSAYDQNQQIAQTLLDVQILDDPVEFQDPRPDPGLLEQLARVSGGKVLRDAKELAELVSSYQVSPGEVVVHRSPLWDTPALWLVLVALLALEWLLRRWWGLA
jgi:uncharacterized membrane protein